MKPDITHKPVFCLCRPRAARVAERESCAHTHLIWREEERFTGEKAAAFWYLDIALIHTAFSLIFQFIGQSLQAKSVGS